MKIADDTFLGNSECEWVKLLTQMDVVQSHGQLHRVLYGLPEKHIETLYRLNPSNAEATFLQSTEMQKSLKNV